jgi:DNA repair protein SbcD/Mre11
MKILHTADWHIGKILHLFDLEEDHRLFFNWFLEVIKEEEIDVVIVAGDVFDQSNPSNESRKLYFELLKDLAELKIQVVITGGNHDSINMLQSSKELLSLLGISIIAGVPEDFEKQIIELKNRNGETKVICAAVPFLRDKDLRSYVAGESSEDRITATREGIIKHFIKCKELILHSYGTKYPTLATGHLYIQGATLSESERDIQIGNQAGVESKKLENLFDYIALGHIHIANRYGNGRIRYCGSPIPLSFSEKEDEKTIIIVELGENTLVSRSIKVPKFRQLLKFVGSWEVVKNQIEMLQSKELLQPLIELEVHEERSAIAAIEIEISNYKINGVNIVKSRYNVLNKDKSLSEITPYGKRITEINEKEVFLKKIEFSSYNDEEKKLLIDAYTILLEEVQSSDSI